MFDVIAAFAVWRLTSLLLEEEGPYRILSRFRKITRKYTRAFDCFWCLSVWVAIPFAVFNEVMASFFWEFSIGKMVVYWLGYSGAAILINKIIDNE